MDFTERNLETISSIHLHNMTIEEVVEADKRRGERFHLSGGVWWREERPFFYYPAGYMTRVVPRQAEPKPWLALGGYYHMVPQGVPGNSVIIVNEISDPANYGLESLGRDKRRQIRRGLAVFRIGRVEELNDLLGDGYQVYLDWAKKTENIRGNLSNPALFNRWITGNFRHPYKLILGAYAENRLVAFLIADAVDSVGKAIKAYSDSSFNSMPPMSALYYAFVKICARHEQIRKVYCGVRMPKPSLEFYKSRLGFRYVSYPSFVSLRPVIRPSSAVVDARGIPALDGPRSDGIAICTLTANNLNSDPLLANSPAMDSCLLGVHLFSCPADFDFLKPLI